VYQCILYRLFRNDRVHIYAFIKIKKIDSKSADVYLSGAGLTCFKARKAKTIVIFLNILGNIYGFMWLQVKWCLYNTFPGK